MITMNMTEVPLSYRDAVPEILITHLESFRAAVRNEHDQIAERLVADALRLAHIADARQNARKGAWKRAGSG